MSENQEILLYKDTKEAEIKTNMKPLPETLIDTHHQTNTAGIRLTVQKLSNKFYLKFLINNLGQQQTGEKRDILLDNHSQFDFKLT